MSDLNNNDWMEYYKATEGRGPRDLLLEVLKLYKNEKTHLAIDLGAGVGNEVLELLHRGWQVLAIDNHEVAIEKLKNRIPEQLNEQVTLIHAGIAEVELQPADLIMANFSLPFLPPDEFRSVWNKITNALKAKGRFIGNLFGPNDAWSDNPDMTFHTRDQIRTLLKDFEIEKLDEIEDELETATGNCKHWHYFDIIAKKK